MKNISLTLVLFLTATLLCGTWRKSSAKPFVNNDSLIAFYPFNGNANDESGNNHNGSVVGAILTTDRFNQSGKAYSFLYNGFSSDRIEVSGTSDLNFATGGFSISAWIKFANDGSIGVNYPIFSKHICGEQSGYILMMFNAKLTFWLAGSGAYNVVSTPTNYTDNSWHQVVAVYDGVTQSIYVDGVLKNSMPFNYNTFNTANWALGGYNGCNGGFEGKVDEIKVFNRALSATEIHNQYIASVSDMVAFFPFNGNAIDESGNGHDGSINGNATMTPDRFMNESKAFTFPDQSSNISLTNSSDLNFEDGFTLSAWVKYKNTYSVVVGKHVCGFVNGFILGIDYDGQMQLWLANSDWSTVSTNYTFIENQWYMITASYDAGTSVAKIYVNGEINGSGNVTYNNYSSYPISMGEVYQNNCQPANMSGAVDEVKIFNRPLSASEILAEYYSSQTGQVAFYPFTGNANDVSGNFNHGVVNGVVLTTDRYGTADKAYYFDGGNTYIEGIHAGNNLPIGSQPRTISCWIKSEEPWGSGDKNIFHYGTAEVAPTNYHLYLNQGNYIGIGNGYGYGTLIGSVPIGDNTWYFVTGVYEGESTNLQHIYINGKLDSSAIISTTPYTLTFSKWKIGEFMQATQSLMGTIDDLRILNIAMNDEEVLNLYLSETTAPVLEQPANQSTVSTLTPALQWNSGFAEAYFRIQLSEDSLFGLILFDETTTGLTTQLPAGLISTQKNYYWRVRTILNVDTGPWSEVWNFNSINTGLSKPMQNPVAFTVSPNPANTSTKFSYTIPFSNSGKIPVSFEVVNSIGISQYKTQENDFGPGDYELNLETALLKTGIYYCTLKAGDYSQVRKLVIIH